MKHMRRFHMTCAYICCLFSAELTYAQWKSADTPPVGTVSSFAFVDATAYAGSFGGGMFQSTDKGATWTEINTDLDNPYVTALSVATLRSGEKMVYAATSGGGVFVRGHRSRKWAEAKAGLTNQDIRSVAVTSAVNEDEGDGIYVSAPGTGIFRSSNYGGSWCAANVGLTCTSVLCLVAGGDEGFGERLFAGTCSGSLFCTTAGETCWKEANCGMQGLPILSMTARHRSDGRADIFAGTDGGGILRSTDHGRSWDIANDGLSHLTVWSLASANDGQGRSVLFAGTSGGGVFASTDNGDHWMPINVGLSDLHVWSLAADGKNLYAGICGGGVYIRSLSEISSSITLVEPAGPIPSCFSLEQNYPNPFNPSTTITFALPLASHTSLRVFDLLGKEVAVLVQGELNAGIHACQWNCVDLPSGVYLYRLETSQFTETRRLVLMK